jgi:hypothetical protein
LLDTAEIQHVTAPPHWSTAETITTTGTIL